MEETQVQKQKLGAGIITISIINLLGVVIGLFGLIVLFIQKDAIAKQGITMPISDSQIIINIILEILLVIAVILILLKKSIGVYSYFLITAISIINTIIDSGFQWTILLSLILPILMGIFIYKKRSIFNI